MNGLSRSYLKVPYDLRTAKQVERRMLVDALHRLVRAGFNIKHYQYTGMGSIYFVDFILFHRFLGMRNLLSVEYSSEIKKRVKFNKPFNCVRLEFGPIGDVIPTLSKDLQHILWLDYDNVISQDMTLDVANAATTLSRGSILLVTVDVEPPTKQGGPRDWRRYYVSNLPTYCSSSMKESDFSQNKLAGVNTRIIDSAIKRGMSGRSDVRFLPLFNFIYADGHEMITIGGMIGGDAEARQIDSCDFSDISFVRRDLAAAPYRVPMVRVTRKERLYLDSAMPPRSRTWIPSEFELDKDAVNNYAEVYRFLPSYAELLL